jgi:HSP20 family protein
MSYAADIQKRESEGAEGLQQRPAVAPAVDVFEDKDELLILADVPGVGKDDVTIHLEKGKLTIEAKRNEPAQGNLLAAEYRPLDYRRTFLVPQGIDADKIVAELNLGVLRLHLPKAASLKPRQIQIKTS